MSDSNHRPAPSGNDIITCIREKLGRLCHITPGSEFSQGSYGVMAITLDFESNNPSSNLGRTLLLFIYENFSG